MSEDTKTRHVMVERMHRVGEREREYVLEVLASEFRTSAGSAMTQRLEERFTEVFGSRYAISFANGTATLHAALAAAGVGAGDEVIVPPLTMASTTFAVLHANAVPVYADIDPATWTLAPTSVEERLTDRTKAIIPVAIYGLAPDLERLMEVANRRGLFVLEDDAQCFLGSCNGRMVGTIGHAASFSFQSSKHMTSGEGGMVVTDDVALAERMRRLGSLGYAAVGAVPGNSKISRETIQDPSYARHVAVGWNYRMSELCAAVALGQLESLDALVQRRVEYAQWLDEIVRSCEWLVPQRVPAGHRHTYWTYAVRLDNPDVSWHRFRDCFRANGGDGIYAAWRLTYQEPAFDQEGLKEIRRLTCGTRLPQEYGEGLCPVAEQLQPRVLQFKTNYWDWHEAEAQAGALQRTVAQLS